ncbi:MAG: UDP-N-acetylglucosamine 2-epimerase (non-hydrolyzing) [Moraxellaceae bacterium]|nr:UDP-N-acetylglucosamine 2-epimerase (non-hydrolyzing) [Moraxellaceae bacterium]
MKKVISVLFGTRPELIKLAPLILAAKQNPDIECEVIFSGQHQELVRDVIEFFNIEIDHELHIMLPGQSLNQLLAKALLQIEGIFDRFPKQRSALVVQGDTTTVLAGALVAFAKQIPVAHVEAGLRSFDMAHPFPEEGNRQLASRLAKWHFAPTQQSFLNLINEGIPKEHIEVTGNTVVDAVLHIREFFKVKGSAGYLPALPFKINDSDKLVLITAHRRENFGEGIENICKGVKALLADHPDIKVVWPVHLNPGVKLVIESHFKKHPQVALLKPLNYPELMAVLEKAFFVLTDSGGIQEECPSFNKPVLILRETTERPEVVEVGAGILVGTDVSKILAESKKLLTDAAHYQAMSNVPNPFGDGLASLRILKAITT